MFDHTITSHSSRFSRFQHAIVALLVCITWKANLEATDNFMQRNTEIMENGRPRRTAETKTSYGCASDHYLEAFAELRRPREPRTAHGDICRPINDGVSWTCPIGCQTTGARDAPFCVWQATDIPCHESTRPTESCWCEGCEIGGVDSGACYSSSTYEWCSQRGGTYCRSPSEASALTEQNVKHNGFNQESDNKTSTDEEKHDLNSEEIDRLSFACLRIGSPDTETRNEVHTKGEIPKAHHLFQQEKWCRSQQYSLHGALGVLIGCCWEPEVHADHSVNGVEFITALMLIGAVSFIMSLFYLVNHHDEDIRKHSWNVISSTISIFTATLIFMGISSFLEKARHMRGFSTEFRASSLLEDVIASYCLFLFWFTILQVCIGAIASLQPGKYGMGPQPMLACQSIDMASVKSTAGTGHKYAAEFHKHKVLLMKCWATLCAHITGFAAIHAGTELQHLDVFSTSPVMVAISVAVQGVGLFIIFLVADRVRAAVWTSGTTEEFELWDETTEEAENDVAALAFSFLSVQGLRHVLLHSGHGYYNLHDEEQNHEHSQSAICFLYVASVLSALLSILPVIFYKTVNDTLSDAPYAKRLLILCQSSAVMGFAWCLFFATRAQVANLPKLPGVSGLERENHSVPMCVLLACILSILGFVIIFFLDMIADMDATGELADKVIASVISSIGILVGFSWERCFDESVHVIAELTKHNGPWSPTLTKVGLAITIACGIIPAWRRHILKRFLEAQTVKDQQRGSARKSLIGTHGTYSKVSINED